MIGPPGTGKTLLAKRLPTILPPLTPAESLETSRTYSVMGLLKAGLTHHNSESGLAGKPCLLVKSKLLVHIVATFQ